MTVALISSKQTQLKIIFMRTHVYISTTCTYIISCYQTKIQYVLRLSNYHDGIHYRDNLRLLMNNIVDYWIIQNSNSIL